MHTLLEDPPQPSHATPPKDPLVIVICPTNALGGDLVSPFDTMQRFPYSEVEHPGA